MLAGDEPAAASGNYLLDRLLGAKIVWCSKAERDMVLKQTFDQAWTDGHRPFLIPYGGSSPVGAAAYCAAMQELVDQGITADYIVFATSSGGTQAGMLLGARRAGYKGHVLGISVDEPAQPFRVKAANLAEEAADRLGWKEYFSPDEVEVNDSYIGAGYGVFGPLEREAIHLFAETEGMLLDPVYTGRAAGGLLDLIRLGKITPGQRVLFWHTGGTPAIFADQYGPNLA